MAGRLGLGAALALALVASSTVGTAPAGSGPPVPFGAYAARRGGETKIQAFNHLESSLGREFDIVRLFYQWDSAWNAGSSTTLEGWALADGKIPVVSVKTKLGDGTPVPWAAIADAPRGSALHDDIVRWAERMRAWPGSVYFSFNHEASNRKSLGNGVVSEYLDAWRRVHRVFERRGATNVVWTWIMGAPHPWEVPPTDRAYAYKWYPGDDVVDVLAVDVYNWNCGGGAGRSFASLTTEFLDFAALHPTEATMVAEYGTNEVDGNASGKANWITQAAEDVKGWPNLQAFMAFHSQYGSSCQWWLDTSQRSLDAARAVGRQPYFGGSGS